MDVDTKPLGEQVAEALKKSESLVKVEWGLLFNRC
jgi:hypothetical protein